MKRGSTKQKKTSRIVKIFIQIMNMISSHVEQAGSLLWLETQMNDMWSALANTRITI